MGGERIPPTPNVSKVIPELKIGVRHEKRRFSNPEGPLGRLKTLRKTVTALIKHERIELNTNRGLEARGYAERLIMEAVRNGDHHKPTMELADFWLEEKQLIHKLFKVLVPRFKNFTANFTRCYGAPAVAPDPHRRCIMELKGNPFPPVIVDSIPRRNLLHNILLDEARNEFRRNKEALIAASIIKESLPSADMGASANEESKETVGVGAASASRLQEETLLSDAKSSVKCDETVIAGHFENLNIKSDRMPDDTIKS